MLNQVQHDVWWRGFAPSSVGAYGIQWFPIPVTLNLVQGPWTVGGRGRGAGVAPWMLNRVGMTWV